MFTYLASLKTWEILSQSPPVMVNILPETTKSTRERLTNAPPPPPDDEYSVDSLGHGVASSLLILNA